MIILFVHNYYKQAGGEDAVVQAEICLLQERGQTVELFEVSNDGIEGLYAKLKTVVNTVNSEASRDALEAEIIQFDPDVLHVHNFFPLLTPSIYTAARKVNVPVIQTLHNYRTICPAAILMRKRKICEKCVKGSAFRSVFYGCYRNSRLGTFAVAHMVENHRKRRTWHKKVDRFIALTDFSRKKFIEGGLPANKIVVKPNFVKKPALSCDFFEKKESMGLGPALFVGRLSHEKGISVLIRAWQKLNVPLRIIGAGPLIDNVKKSRLQTLTLLGRQTSKQVSSEMEQAALLIMPSICYEAFPIVLIEAFSHGLPVVTSSLGSMAEIVEDGVTGLHFEAGNVDHLAERVRWMYGHPDECKRMGENARRVYEKKYTPERNYEMLMAIYQEAIDGCKKNAN